MSAFTFVAAMAGTIQLGCEEQSASGFGYVGKIRLSRNFELSRNRLELSMPLLRSTAEL